MIATRTMVMLSTIALALLVGCAGEMQEDPMLGDKIAKADEIFKSRQYEEAGVLFEEVAGEAAAAGDYLFILTTDQDRITCFSFIFPLIVCHFIMQLV